MALVGTALSFCYYGLSGNDAVGSAFGATIVLLSNFIQTGIYRVVEGVVHSGNSKLCIDTQPDRNTPPTKPDQLSKAKLSRAMYGIWATVSLGYDCYRGINNPQNIITDALSDLSIYTRFYKGFERFNKVAKGEWVIVDLPPREKITVSESEKAPLHAQPQLTS